MNKYLSVSALTARQSPLQYFTRLKNRRKFLFTAVELFKWRDQQRYGSDEWQIAFLDIDTKHLTTDTQRYNSPQLAHTLG